MVIKVGDRVKFLSDTRSGIVKSIVHGLAMVDVDGFEIPTQVSELVVVAVDEEKKAFRIMGGEEKEEIRGHRGDKKQQNKPREYRGPVYGKISLESEWEDDPIELPKRKSNNNVALEEFYSQIVGKKNQNASQDAEEPEVPFDVTDCKVSLLFVPSDDTMQPEKSNLDMYLVNDSSYRLYYNIGIWKEQRYVEIISIGEMENDSKIQISSFQRKQLNEIIQLQVSILPYKPKKFIPVDGASGKLELHPLKFVKNKNYVENDYFDKPSIEYSLIANVK